jgi:hypothetical protein
MIQRLLTLALAVLTATGLNVAAGPVAPAAADDVTLDCFPHAPTNELRYDDTWGAARSGGRGHQGTDIMSPKGLEVLAVADGTVVGLKGGPLSGYYIRLDHNGWESWYMHLNNDTPGTDDGRGGEEAAYVAGLSIGDRVAAGSVIGYVGDSGNAESAGSHTHFELHIGDRAVNPYSYLTDVAARVDAMYDAVTPLLVSPAVAPANFVSSLRDDAWGALVASPSAQCLPDSFKDSIEQVFGEFPSEGVLLTGVVAR